MQIILNQFVGTQIEQPTHHRPRDAEALFWFDAGPPPTTLAQHPTYSTWSNLLCSVWAANTNRHPSLEPAARIQLQLQCHLIIGRWPYKVVVSTAAFHATVRGSFPGRGG